LRLGELDAADLTEQDVAAFALDPRPGEESEPQLLRFRDYERVVLRFAPDLLPVPARSLVAEVDRGALVSRLFDQTGRRAGACLPGEPDSLGQPEAGELLLDELPLLVEEDREDLRAVAEWVVAVWQARGVPAQVVPLPRRGLRDRLAGGRYRAALLTFTRDRAEVDEAIRVLSREGWACPGPPEPGASSARRERWFREECGIFPLVSLDRVVAVGAGVNGVAFDPVGRVDWSRAVPVPAP
jgi:hypothetical protein